MIHAGKITKTEKNFEGNKFVTEYQYGGFKNLVGMTFGANSSVTYNYNEKDTNYTLGRLNSSVVNVGENKVLKSTLSYEPGLEANTTTNRINQIDNNVLLTQRQP